MNKFYQCDDCLQDIRRGGVTFGHTIFCDSCTKKRGIIPDREIGPALFEQIAKQIGKEPQPND